MRWAFMGAYAASNNACNNNCLMLIQLRKTKKVYDYHVGYSYTLY